METRRTVRVRNGRCREFLRVERGGLEFSGAPPAGTEGRKGQALPALIEVAGTARSVVGNGLGLGAIERGALVLK
jgi:hypothetical protein